MDAWNIGPLETIPFIEAAGRLAWFIAVDSKTRTKVPGSLGQCGSGIRNDGMALTQKSSIEDYMLFSIICYIS